MSLHTYLVAGTMLACGAVAPASAEPIRGDIGSRVLSGSNTTIAFTQFRGYGRHGFRGRGYYGRGYYGRRYHRRGYGAGALVGGLAAGALIGGAIASQAQPAPVYGAPSGDAMSYCVQRFKSYDPASGTYLGYDGQRHPCP
jgi:hypothetical protein